MNNLLPRMYYPSVPHNSLASVSLNSSSPMNWERVNNPNEIPPHCHEFCEIGIVLDGRGWHKTESQEHWIGRGDVFVSFPRSVHEFSNIDGLRKINIYYIAEWFLSDLTNYTDSTFIGPLFFSDTSRSGSHRHTLTFRIEEATIGKIEAELIDCKSPPTPELALKWQTNCFSKIILLLAKEYATHQGITELHFPENVFRLIEDIEKKARVATLPDFGQIAQKIGVDRDYLSKQFRSVMGLSPMQYFQKRRVQIACRKILETKLRFNEIASELGYSDEAHFNRSFKKEIHMSPGQYRKRFCRG